ncbi:MAG: purine-nucleoside phosphorylase [Deltaproteobacteria bacterium]|nr:purine-nucleoside phosphorylase [Deltaproteobacteria bacterium]
MGSAGPGVRERFEAAVNGCVPHAAGIESERLRGEGLLAPVVEAGRKLVPVFERLGWVPDVAVVLGSGLSGFEDHVESAERIPYGDAGLPSPGVAGHSGQLVLGTIRGRRVAVLAGRVHGYEGHEMPVVTAAVRTLAACGVRDLLLSNAAGAANPDYVPGDLMVIRDHINFMGSNPLRGPNAEGLGPRFPDMTEPYDAGVRGLFHAAAARNGIRMREGVYLALSGPSYETPAEIRAFRIWGADAVGMSTVPEVIVGRHAGMRVGAVSCITNMAAGLSGGLLSHDEVKQVGAAVSRSLAAVFEDVIAAL